MKHEEIDELCNSGNFIGWVETSAKINLNIDAAMMYVNQIGLETF